MKTAIILHGMPNKESYFSDRPAQSNSHWFPWLQQELLRNGILAQTPEMPEPYAPDYEKWRSIFELFPVDGETMLIGHSCGAGFLIRWLSEHTVVAGKLALVAPWVDPNNQWAPNMFGSFEIDTTLPERVAAMAMFSSTDDDQEELDTFGLLKSKFPSMTLKEFSDRGHFTGIKNVEFPELRDYLLGSH